MPVSRAEDDAAAPAQRAVAALALLQSQSLASVVHSELERLILAGELAPGARLTEAMLAARLGVSRGPIREACRRLEESGLVRQEKNRGVFVRSIPLAEAMELYEVRAVLDEAVGRRLAAQSGPAQIKALRSLVEQMEKLLREGNAADYHALNFEFHDRLVEYAGNRQLTALYRRVVNQLSLYRRLNLADGRLLPASVSEHRAIVKAIAAGDAEAAGLALREHALHSRQRTGERHAGAAADPAPAQRFATGSRPVARPEGGRADAPPPTVSPRGKSPP